MDVDLYAEQGVDVNTLQRMKAHLAACPMCRGLVERDREIESALVELPRAMAPRDLIVRIMSAAELRGAEARARWERLPFIVAATFFSFLLSIWFGLQMLLAFQDNGALDYFSLITSRPEVFSLYSADAYFALIESLPILEIVLTVFALLTVLVLAQQWVDIVQPNTSYLLNGHSQSKSH
jgi:hypothetical protein